MLLTSCGRTTDRILKFSEEFKTQSFSSSFQCCIRSADKTTFLQCGERNWPLDNAAPF